MSTSMKEYHLPEPLVAFLKSCGLHGVPDHRPSAPASHCLSHLGSKHSSSNQTQEDSADAYSQTATRAATRFSGDYHYRHYRRREVRTTLPRLDIQRDVEGKPCKPHSKYKFLRVFTIELPDESDIAIVQVRQKERPDETRNINLPACFY